MGGGAAERSGDRFRPQSRTTFLQATPIDVSELLSELVFETIPTVVMTSATLTVQGGFEHMRKRLGLRDARELVVPSHFHYGEQALLYLPPSMPDPRDPEFPEAAANCIRRVLEITKGRAFCLFTSYSQMRDLYERLMPVLDFPILLHGTAPRKALLGGVPRHAQLRAVRDVELLARGGRAGRSAELRDYRQAAVCRAQRSRGCGAHEGH